MEFTVATDDGEELVFECFDNLVSLWVCQTILEGKTYPDLPFVDDVAVILDVGANCGAASVHLSRHHPSAVVHAFEPGSAARAVLERNTVAYPQIVVHPFGLGDTDLDAVPLYHGTDDPGSSSLLLDEHRSEESEPVQVRAAGAWAAEAGIERIDVLKVDVEGLEVEVLESLGDLLSTVKVLYVEYDSRAARRRIMAMLDESHEVYLSMLMALDQGEIVFLRRDLAEHPDAVPHLRAIFRAGTAGASG